MELPSEALLKPVHQGGLIPSHYPLTAHVILNSGIPMELGFGWREAENHFVNIKNTYITRPNKNYNFFKVLPKPNVHT